MSSAVISSPDWLTEPAINTILSEERSTDNNSTPTSAWTRVGLSSVVLNAQSLRPVESCCHIGNTAEAHPFTRGRKRGSLI